MGGDQVGQPFGQVRPDRVARPVPEFGQPARGRTAEVDLLIRQGAGLGTGLLGAGSTWPARRWRGARDRVRCGCAFRTVRLRGTGDRGTCDVGHVWRSEERRGWKACRYSEARLST